MEQIEKHRAEAKRLLGEARAIVSRCEREGKSLTPEQEARVAGLMAQAEDHVKAVKTRNRVNTIGSKGIRPDGQKVVNGWTTAAKALVKGERHVEVKLADLMGKDLDAADMFAESTFHEPGLRPLLEDQRNIVGALPTADPGQGALHVDEFVITSRGLAAGSADVERSPLDATAKAEVDLVIDLESADLKQYAALVSDLPNQAFDSIDGLTQLLVSALGRELTKRLDDATLAAIEAALPATVSGGTGFLGKVRRAISDLEDNGARAALAIVSPEDLEAIDMMTEDEVPIGFARDRFGLRYIAHPSLAAGEGYVLDPAGIVLYRANAKFDRDDVTGFDTNSSRVRLEYNALALVREPGRIIDLAAAS